MPFPEVERVIYDKNPLVEVICQLRFPKILKIERELPAELQEEIREQFPNYNEKDNIKLRVDVAGAVSSTQQTNKIYEFITKDNNWKVTLASDFIALSTEKYKDWEEFKGTALSVFKPFIEIYRPQFFSRVGLRYRNVIRFRPEEVAASYFQSWKNWPVEYGVAIPEGENLVQLLNA